MGKWTIGEIKKLIYSNPLHNIIYIEYIAPKIHKYCLYFVVKKTFEAHINFGIFVFSISFRVSLKRSVTGRPSKYPISIFRCYNSQDNSF